MTVTALRQIDPPHSVFCTQALIAVGAQHFIVSCDHRNNETQAFYATSDGEFVEDAPDLSDATLVEGVDAVSFLRCVSQLMGHLSATPADADATAPQSEASDEDQADEPSRPWCPGLAVLGGDGPCGSADPCPSSNACSARP